MMVHPLHRLCQAVLPQMITRQAGKIVVFGSATALKGMPTVTAYSAARAAQSFYIRSLGVEVAKHNIQANLIAQNYVENPVYYPPQLREKESFQKSLSAGAWADWPQPGKMRCSRCFWLHKKVIFRRPIYSIPAVGLNSQANHLFLVDICASKTKIFGRTTVKDSRCSV